MYSFACRFCQHGTFCSPLCLQTLQSALLSLPFKIGWRSHRPLSLRQSSEMAYHTRYAGCWNGNSRWRRAPRPLELSAASQRNFKGHCSHMSCDLISNCINWMQQAAALDATVFLKLHYQQPSHYDAAHKDFVPTLYDITHFLLAQAAAR